MSKNFAQVVVLLALLMASGALSPDTAPALAALYAALSFVDRR